MFVHKLDSRYSQNHRTTKWNNLNYEVKSVINLLIYLQIGCLSYARHFKCTLHDQVYKVFIYPSVLLMVAQEYIYIHAGSRLGYGGTNYYLSQFYIRDLGFVFAAEMLSQNRPLNFLLYPEE